MKRSQVDLSKQEAQVVRLREGREGTTLRQHRKRVGDDSTRMQRPPFNTVSGPQLHRGRFMQLKHPQPERLESLLSRAKREREEAEAAAREAQTTTNKKSALVMTTFPWQGSTYKAAHQMMLNQPSSSILDCQMGTDICARINISPDDPGKQYCSTYIAGQFEPTMPIVVNASAEDARLFREMLRTKRKYAISKPENQVQSKGLRSEQRCPFPRLLPDNYDMFRQRCREEAAVRKQLKRGNRKQHPSYIQMPRRPSMQQMHEQQKLERPKRQQPSSHESIPTQSQDLAASPHSPSLNQSTFRRSGQQHPTSHASQSTKQKPNQVQLTNIEQYRSYIHDQQVARGPRTTRDLHFVGQQHRQDTPQQMSPTAQRSSEHQIMQGAPQQMSPASKRFAAERSSHGTPQRTSATPQRAPIQQDKQGTPQQISPAVQQLSHATPRPFGLNIAQDSFSPKPQTGHAQGHLQMRTQGGGARIGPSPSSKSRD